jgi:hypothetical protein
MFPFPPVFRMYKLDFEFHLVVFTYSSNLLSSSIVYYRCTVLYFSLQEADSVGTSFDARDNAVFAPLSGAAFYWPMVGGEGIEWFW